MAMLTPLLDGIEDVKNTPDSCIFGELLFKKQQEAMANFAIIGDRSWNTSICKTDLPKLTSSINWINKGEIISGSSVMQLFNNSIDADDVDIYFHSREDAIEFLKLNKSFNCQISDEDRICKYAHFKSGNKCNIIWGIEYADGIDLIKGFDIRACSMFIDPNAKQFVSLCGAITDAYTMKIHFNPTPRAITVARLIKYIEKNFEIDRYQRLLFADLIRSPHFNPELELTTNYG